MEAAQRHCYSVNLASKSLREPAHTLGSRSRYADPDDARVHDVSVIWGHGHRLVNGVVRRFYRVSWAHYSDKDVIESEGVGGLEVDEDNIQPGPILQAYLDQRLAPTEGGHLLSLTPGGATAPPRNDDDPHSHESDEPDPIHAFILGGGPASRPVAGVLHLVSRVIHRLRYGPRCCGLPRALTHGGPAVARSNGTGCVQGTRGGASDGTARIANGHCTQRRGFGRLLPVPVSARRQSEHGARRGATSLTRAGQNCATHDTADRTDPFGRTRTST